MQAHLATVRVPLRGKECSLVGTSRQCMTAGAVGQDEVCSAGTAWRAGAHVRAAGGQRLGVPEFL